VEKSARLKESEAVLFIGRQVIDDNGHLRNVIGTVGMDHNMWFKIEGNGLLQVDTDVDWELTEALYKKQERQKNEQNKRSRQGHTSHN